MKFIVSILTALFALGFSGTSYADSCSSVKREMIYGQTALKHAKDKQGYLKSAKEFEVAINKAPDCAAAHFNLGIVYEKAGEYKKSLRALQNYLRLSPKATDANTVQDKIYELEYLSNEVSRLVDWSRFNGTWCIKGGVCDKSLTVQILIKDNSFNSKNEWIYISASEGSLETHKTTFTGQINPDGAISGEHTYGVINTTRQSCPNIYVAQTGPFTGRLIRNKTSPSEDKIELVLRKWSGSLYDRNSCTMIKRSTGRWFEVPNVWVRKN